MVISERLNYIKVPMTFPQFLTSSFLRAMLVVSLSFGLSDVFAQTTDPIKLQQFEDAILRGEDFLQAKEYAKAKAEYQKALSIDPTAKYPKDKLTQIRKFYIDPQDEALYSSAMESGNRYMQSKNYEAARDQFSIAVNIKPEEKTARDKMAEAEKQAKAQQEKQKQYNKLIEDADKFYASGKITEARESYSQASGINPDERYPQQRINEIDTKAAADKALKDSYENILAEADNAYIDRDFNTAKLKYEQAQRIKPGENYPKSMLERVAEGMSQMKDAQQNYQSVIAGADKLYNARDYETALLAYQNASKILPGEKYPGTQIQKITSILQQKQNLEENYNKAIASGDNFLAEKKLTEARAEFQKANDLKPNEAYPKQKIEDIALQLLALKEAERTRIYQETIKRADNQFAAKDYDNALITYREAAAADPDNKYPASQINLINNTLSEMRASTEAYAGLIGKADQAFEAKDYQQSLGFYREASNLKPNETHPAKRISAIEEILRNIATKEEQYNAAIANADKLFNSNNFEASLTVYQEALVLKPEETYPKDRILLINNKISEQTSQKERINAFIANADKLLEDKKYDEAIQLYQNALALVPGDAYAISQGNKANTLKSEMIAAKAQYDKKIVEGDQYFAAADYGNARKSYTDASGILPDETYPAEKIAAINQILEDLKSLDENYARYVSEGDKAYKEKQYQPAQTAYEKAVTLKPAEKYPAAQLSLIAKALEAEMELMGSYQKAVAEADALYNSGKLNDASKKYAEALKVKPEEKYPSEQIDRINTQLANQKQIEENYKSAVAEADRLLAAKEYRSAQTKYNEALTLKPGEQYPTGKIAEINGILGEQEQTEQQYATAISLGDEKFRSNLLDEAELAYNQAKKLKPGETYPASQLELIIKKRDAERTASANFANAIAEGDASFSGKDYTSALASYQKALEYRPGAEHPTARISEINNIMLEQKQLADKGYYEAIEQADRLFAEKDYNSSIRFYENASALKPAEKYPKEKILSIRGILQERARNQMEAYNKLIMNADRLYQDKIFDQAIDAYNESALAKPDEVYPIDMIAKIRKYLEDHAIVDLVNNPTAIDKDTEKKFNFSPIEMRLRKNNYISIKARKTSETDPKVYVNYGKGSQKNGGIVLRSITTDENGDFLVRVSIQDKWYREDNNWIGIYAEGGSIEISKMQIAQGD